MVLVDLEKCLYSIEGGGRGKGVWGSGGRLEVDSGVMFRRRLFLVFIKLLEVVFGERVDILSDGFFGRLFMFIYAGLGFVE